MLERRKLIETAKYAKYAKRETKFETAEIRKLRKGKLILTAKYAKYAKGKNDF